MNRDDNTPALGVPTDVVGAAVDNASFDPAAEQIDQDLGIPTKDVNLFDAYWHELARMAADDPRPDSAEDEADVEKLYAMCLDSQTKTRDQLLEERHERLRKTSR